MKLVLATTLSGFQQVLAHRRPVRRVHRDMTIVPSGCLPVVVTRKRKSQSGSTGLSQWRSTLNFSP